MNQCQDDWYEWLSIAELTYNDQIHASMHSSPFMLDTRQNPRLGIEPLRKSHLETLNNSTSWMEAVTKEVHLALTRAADNMAHFHDAHCRVPTKCSQGQGLAQWTEHHGTVSNEEARPHVAWPVPSGQGHFTECLKPQVAFILWLNSPHLLSHSTMALQSRNHH